MTWFRRALAVVAVAVVSAAAMPGARATTPTSAPDWELIVVTIATHDIDNLTVTAPVSVMPTGGGPVVAGLGLADNATGPGHVFVENWGGSSIRAKLKAGSLSYQYRLAREPSGASTGNMGLSDNGRMTGVSKLYIIGFWTNARVGFGPVRVTATSGRAQATTLIGSGARTISVGDSADSGSFVEAGATAGTSIHSVTAPQGVVGGFARDTLTTGAFMESWSSPDGRSGQAYAVSGPGSNSNPSSDFAGPAGRWKITWSGAVTDLVSAPVAAWAPIGSYWTVFGQPTQPPTVN